MTVSLYAALLGLIFACLTMIVIAHRVMTNMGFKQDDEALQRKVRAHGNFIESVPIALILITLTEMTGLICTCSIAWMAGLLMVGRLSHALSALVLEQRNIGTIKGFPIFRIIGMVCTLISIIWPSIFLLVNAL